MGRDTSQQWVEATSKMFCSLWDGGISTGKLEGVCPSQCQGWYQACKEDFFTGDARANELGAGDITFCNKNSLVCSQLKDIYSDSKDFWKQMGLLVNENESNWYDGIPWQIKAGKAIKKKKSTEKKKTPKKPKEPQTWFESFLRLTSNLYTQYPITFMVAYGAAVLLVLAVSTLLLFRFFVHKPQDQVYIDEDIKEKRRKIMEKKAKKT